MKLRDIPLYENCLVIAVTIKQHPVQSVLNYIKHSHLIYVDNSEHCKIPNPEYSLKAKLPEIEERPEKQTIYHFGF